MGPNLYVFLSHEETENSFKSKYIENFSFWPIFKPLSEESPLIESRPCLPPLLFFFLLLLLVTSVVPGGLSLGLGGRWGPPKKSLSAWNPILEEEGIVLFTKWPNDSGCPAWGGAKCWTRGSPFLNLNSFDARRGPGQGRDEVPFQRLFPPGKVFLPSGDIHKWCLHREGGMAQKMTDEIGGLDIDTGEGIKIPKFCWHYL